MMRTLIFIMLGLMLLEFTSTEPQAGLFGRCRARRCCGETASTCQPACWTACAPSPIIYTAAPAPVTTSVIDVKSVFICRFKCKATDEWCFAVGSGPDQAAAKQNACDKIFTYCQAAPFSSECSCATPKPLSLKQHYFKCSYAGESIRYVGFGVSQTAAKYEAMALKAMVENQLGLSSPIPCEEPIIGP